MTAIEGLDPAVVEAFKKEYGRRLAERSKAMQHPAGLLDHVQCVDAKSRISTRA